MNIETDLQEAIEHHANQRFEAAALAYRAVLAAAPRHPDANHYLGLLMVQTQGVASGVPFLVSAVEAAPEREEFRAVCVEALTLEGRHDDARSLREGGAPKPSVDADVAANVAVDADAGVDPRPRPESAPAGAPASATASASAPAEADAALEALAREFEATIDTLHAQALHDNAETLALEMVKLLPDHGFGWKTLAHAQLRRGRLDAALAPLEHAVARLPDDAELAFHLAAARAMRDGIAEENAGNFAAAGRHYAQVLAAHPAFPPAHHRLGFCGVMLGQPEGAIPHLEKALGGDPMNLQYWTHYIDALLHANQLDAAWIAMGMAQERGLEGDVAEGLINIMTQLGLTAGARLHRVQPSAPQAAAAPVAQQAAKNAPTPRLLHSLSDAMEPERAYIDELIARFNRGEIAEVAEAARALVERFPAHGFGWKALAVALHRLGQYEESDRRAARALEIMPGDTDLLQIVIAMRAAKGSFDDAEAMAREVIAKHPDHVEGHRLLGAVLMSQGRLDESLAAAQRAVDLASNAWLPNNTLAVTLMKLGRLDEAAAYFRRASDLNPADDMSHSNLAFCLTHIDHITPEALYAEHRRFAEKFEAPLKPHWAPHANTRDPERQLRVGFISGDFCHHAVASFFEPMLAPLSRDPGLTLYAYSNTTIDDSVTRRLRDGFAHWRDVVGTSNDALAEQIRADGIDILIDLSGHTAQNRLLAIARKPAPVQACAIGYPGTTGLDAVDYFLADRFWVPSDKFRNQFSEQIVYLPTMAPFEADRLCPPVNHLPALHNGYVTFGSFNRLDKINEDVIELWSRLLHEVPGSRMLIAAMPKGSAGPDQVAQWFARHGIGRERLDFKPRAGIAVYLQQHHRVDICLDTFPFSGLTTALHSLWMGVPTLTLPGRTVPGRSGLTAMSHVGLESFIATDRDDFVRRGVAFASDIPALAELRLGMRERCRRSPMFRPELAAASLSLALRGMWRRWCEGLPPESFTVSGTDDQSAPFGTDE
ncbi:tetratricopeptide repeat protein [Paraburkholderia sp. J41]|uniref:tetratricopeptide repeat protein n=1 Tax=Paraburkholderia sp. J41 TaxID=2805433 RepID=UPI002AC34A73|nr:tetratricopeptide repeat protein [Paraburkholderia sp. J41]